MKGALRKVVKLVSWCESRVCVARLQIQRLTGLSDVLFVGLKLLIVIFC